MLILIDNGHGHNTPGKRSPDGQFREAFYTREIAKRIVADLTDRGFTAQLLVPGKRIRTDYSDNDPDWEENFYILRNSHCAAVLTENFFMDNHSDMEYIQSQAGKQAIIVTHIEGIIEYLNSIK